MTPAAERQLAISASRLPEGAADLLRPVFEVREWALWCTLYVDSSNAGSGALTSPDKPAYAWAWGGRGRLTDEVADILGAPRYLTLSGVSPEAAGKDSGIAELWGIVHAVRATLSCWPWLAGIGVKCDNAEAVRAIRGCDGRDGGARVWSGCRKKLRSAQTALLTLIQPLGVHLRATHVHGHNRAEQPQQRAFNRDADLAARRAARDANRPT